MKTIKFDTVCTGDTVNQLFIDFYIIFNALVVIILELLRGIILELLPI